MKVRAIDFVSLTVADMERSMRFYRDTLGLDVPLTLDSSTFKEFDTPPVAMALYEDPQSPGVNAVIALAVEDVRAAVEELRAEGVPILMEPVETSDCFTATIADPDGNQLVLHQRQDGTAG
ncbi:MAG TPA: VOC family protein [Chloroflexota bacterium]|jgi:predicted enzyme related to lactoylglutathione lyase|nr:VOC family protein [Chloroflexota bacterium]